MEICNHDFLDSSSSFPPNHTKPMYFQGIFGATQSLLQRSLQLAPFWTFCLRELHFFSMPLFSFLFKRGGYHSQ